MKKEIREFRLENIFGDIRIVKRYITEVEDDCIHIKTVDDENICISI